MAMPGFKSATDQKGLGGSLGLLAGNSNTDLSMLDDACFAKCFGDGATNLSWEKESMTAATKS